MTILLAALAGLLGAAMGIGLGLLVGDLAAGLMQVPTMEGQAGMLVVFGFAPLGGLVGIVLAVVTTVALRSRGRGAGAVAAKSLGALALLAVAAALSPVAYGWLFPSEYLGGGSDYPVVAFELRLPAGAFVPADQALVAITLDTDKNQSAAVLPAEGWRAEEDGRPVLRGTVPLYYRTADRLLVVRLPLEPDRIFRLRLRADPRPSDAFGPWQPVDLVADGPAAPPRAAPSGEGSALRLRVTGP